MSTPTPLDVGAKLAKAISTSSTSFSPASLTPFSPYSRRGHSASPRSTSTTSTIPVHSIASTAACWSPYGSASIASDFPSGYPSSSPSYDRSGLCVGSCSPAAPRQRSVLISDRAKPHVGRRGRSRESSLEDGVDDDEHDVDRTDLLQFAPTTHPFAPTPPMSASFPPAGRGRLPIRASDECEAECDGCDSDLGHAHSNAVINAFDYRVAGPVAGGVGGVYLLHHKRDPQDLKIFKPADEEGYASPPYSPRYSDSTAPSPLGRTSLKRGIEYGDSTAKERAAYLLDHEHFAGVPATHIALVDLSQAEDGSNVCYGSLQDFQPHVSSCEDMGSTRFTPHAVHRVGILDIRLLNLDRHLGNLLVTEDDGLCPIDHGYVLPSYKAVVEVRFEWLYWHQCKVPFSADAVKYVLELDAAADCELLRSLRIREESITACFIATVFLQACVGQSLTLFQAASMIQRSNECQPSFFELLLEQATRDHEPSHVFVPPADFQTTLGQAIRRECAMKT